MNVVTVIDSDGKKQKPKLFIIGESLGGALAFDLSLIYPVTGGIVLLGKYMKAQMIVVSNAYSFLF